jgi:two-component system chemotaxis response regulator CheB
MGINGEGRILLSKDLMENSVRPSVSYLFRSVAKNYGANSAGVLLTGMGKDGSAELKLIKDKGGITIAQDRETSVVYGMPGEAVKFGGASYVMTPEQIAEKLSGL